MNSIMVNSQTELDNIPVDFNGHIIINFGSKAVPARIIHSYKNATFLIIKDIHVRMESSNPYAEIYDNATLYAYQNCLIAAYGDSIVHGYDECRIIARGNTSINLHQNSHVDAFWNARVYAYDHSSVKAYDNADVYLYDKSSAESYKGTTLHICGNDVVFRCNNQD